MSANYNSLYANSFDPTEVTAGAYPNFKKWFFSHVLQLTKI
jgi:hypothetical protein